MSKLLVVIVSVLVAAATVGCYFLFRPGAEREATAAPPARYFQCDRCGARFPCPDVVIATPRRCPHCGRTGTVSLQFPSESWHVPGDFNARLGAGLVLGGLLLLAIAVLARAGQHKAEQPGGKALLRFACPVCSRPLQLPACVAGGTTSCPGCLAEFIAPGLGERPTALAPGEDLAKWAKQMQHKRMRRHNR